jgi:hypothetical protein
MALETHNTIYPGFGGDMEIKGAVNVIYDPLITGFRAATTEDYLIDVQSGSFTVNIPTTQGVTGIVSVNNFPTGVSQVDVSGSVDIGNWPDIQGMSGIVNVNNFPSNVFVPHLAVITGSGNVPTVRYAEFIFSTGFAGTIMNMSFNGAADQFYSFPLLDNNKVYSGIAYNIPTGSARLTYF